VGLSDFINVVFTQPIFNVLMLLYHLFGDFGLSIIVLTVIIRLILFPLTLHQLKSAKAMQELQPQITALRKKYKDDQRAQALALQELYKEYNVNPFSGCLPLLVQFPVLYGLYFAFRAVLDDAALRGVQGLERLNGFIYPFLPRFSHFPNINLDWFTFLNPTWHFSLATPDPTHILPVLAAVATFVQLRMAQMRNPTLQAASSNATSGNDPLAAQQQTMRMMSWLMPLVTLFIGWTFPAGLALYWTTGSIFMAIQQYFVTGWGALLTTPEFMKRADADTQGPRSTRQLTGTDSDIEEELSTVTSGTRSLRNGTASSRRRTRSSSSRRRGTVPKRNPTRG
jgi:YidC/Oxa1 family membrane protein insertase